VPALGRSASDVAHTADLLHKESALSNDFVWRSDTTRSYLLSGAEQCHLVAGGKCCLPAGANLAKNLSVNYVDLERHLPERDDRGSEMVERDETALKFLVAHQQLAEPVEPAMANLDHPTSRLLLRVAPLDIGLFAAADDVGNVAMLFDGARVVGTAITGIPEFDTYCRKCLICLWQVFEIATTAGAVGCLGWVS